MISKHILKEIITANEDFILRHTGDIVHNGLVKACKWLGVNEDTIFTWDDEEYFGAEGVDIKVIPA